PASAGSSSRRSSVVSLVKSWCRNPTLTRKSPVTPARPLARSGARQGARFASVLAPAQLHHSLGHDRNAPLERDPRPGPKEGGLGDLHPHTVTCGTAQAQQAEGVLPLSAPGARQKAASTVSVTRRSARLAIVWNISSGRPRALGSHDGGCWQPCRGRVGADQ